MSKRWYVVQAYSSYEKYVHQALLERIKKANLEDMFEEILVPSEQLEDLSQGKKRTYERKFFPGYVLVKMELNDDTWQLVRSVPKTSGFVGGSTLKPAPLSDKEVEAIFARIQDSVEKPKSKFTFEPGEVVRVVDGPFRDFNGSVEEVNYDKSLVKVSVSIFGRSTPVELEFSQVEKS